jgi:hypothetical protein
LRRGEEHREDREDDDEGGLAMHWSQQRTS